MEQPREPIFYPNQQMMLFDKSDKTEELLQTLYSQQERRVDQLKIGEKKYLETCELVEELKKREGVEAHMAEPYKDLTVTINGPAIVLVVTD